MIEQLYDAAVSGKDVRKNLIEIKQQLENEASRQALEAHTGKDYKGLERLLFHEDGKTRKNAALILGKLKAQSALDTVFNAYVKEQQLFVRSAYVTAMRMMDCGKYMDALKERRDYLEAGAFEANEVKHVQEELKALYTLILKEERPKKHKFTGYHLKHKVLLITVKGFEDLTINLLPKEWNKKPFKGGVLVESDDLWQVLGLRTYKGLLFTFGKNRKMDAKPETIVQNIMEGHLLDYLDQCHEGGGRYYFRVDVKGWRKDRPEFAKKVAAGLEQAARGRLVNTTTDYEMELRVVEGKDGMCSVFLKLYTIFDHRFDYREQVVASSISPAAAATVMELAGPWLREEAQVLDPCCGVGTMLIERDRKLKTRCMYGIDLYGEALSGARINTDKSGCQIYYVQRDFYDFKHEYQFDEIITNLPRVTAKSGKETVQRVYSHLFERMDDLLKDGGTAVVCGDLPEVFRELVAKSPWLKQKALRFLLPKDDYFAAVLVKVD